MSIRPFLYICLTAGLLSGCATTQTNSLDHAEAISRTGMLQIFDPAKCPLADGCGPRYSLLDMDMKPAVALTGLIDDNDHGKIITVQGPLTNLAKLLRTKTGYDNILSQIEVTEYQTQTTIPYASFLSSRSAAWAKRKYGCEPLWDRSFSWRDQKSGYRLIVRFTNNRAATQPKQFIELHFDGNHGELVDLKLETSDINPCN